MNHHKLLSMVLIALLAKTILDPIADILAGNPGAAAFLLLLGAALLAFTSFFAGMVVTHLKFVRVTPRK